MKSVLEGLFRASRASEFNDPFDCDGGVLNVEPPEVLRKDAVNRGTMRDYGDPLLNVAMWWDAFRETLKSKEFMDRYFRIMCFRKYSGRDGRVTTLFWSHYADNGRGIRVIFDLPEFPEHWKLRDVSYGNEVPMCDPSKCVSICLDAEMKRFIEERIFTKGKAWKRENESRLCIPLNGDMESLAQIGADIFVKWPYEKIVGVDFGCRVGDDVAKSWIEICRNIRSLRHLKFRKAKQFGYGYQYVPL